MAGGGAAEAVREVLREAPRGASGASLRYGTSGFRGPAGALGAVVARCALLAATRATAVGGPGGVMVTASHNPPGDNGVKLLDERGALLGPAWEAWAERLVAADDARVAAVLAQLVAWAGADADAGTSGYLVLGHDSRESSPGFAGLAARAARAAGVEVVPLGLVTTPVLRYMVRAPQEDLAAGWRALYCVRKRQRFRELMTGAKRMRLPGGGRLIVDCANGVGYHVMQEFQDEIPVVCVNGPADGPVNLECGADHVHKKQRMPKIYSKQPTAPAGALHASLDGDGDRVVFFKQRQDSHGDRIVLADGDRCACLVASFLLAKLRVLGLTPSFAVAQTAYSDGAATQFLEDLQGVKVLTTFTGVKHLERALEGYDLGVYWESNGHGTILHSEAFRRQLDALSPAEDAEKKRALSVLVKVLELASDTAGDAIINILLVFAILSLSQTSFEGWMQLYRSRKSVNIKVQVQNKHIVETEDFDRKVKRPTALKEAVELASRDGCSRCFVRKSGTEDVVRVYAEADTQAAAEDTAMKVARAVWDTCEGIGGRP